MDVLLPKNLSARQLQQLHCNGMPMMCLVIMLYIAMQLDQTPSPDVVEYFCGIRAISRACRSKGLQVRGLDICLSIKHDILSSVGFMSGTRAPLDS